MEQLLSQGLPSTRPLDTLLSGTGRRPSHRGCTMQHYGKVRAPVLSFIEVLSPCHVFRQTSMIKTVVFFTGAGTVTTPRTPPLPQHGLAASPSWSSSGRRRMWWSSLSAGSFQALLLHVCEPWTSCLIEISWRKQFFKQLSNFSVLS